MRYLLLLLSFALLPALFAQQQVQIKEVAALDAAPDLRKSKEVQDALQGAGFNEEELKTILDFGNRQNWPEGIRTDTARAANAPYIPNYVCFRLCAYNLNGDQQEVLMVPARNNIHMPEGMRPLGDFFLALPEHALSNVEGNPQKRPMVSRGPAWAHRPKVKIVKADELFGSYDLEADSAGLKALEDAGMSPAEIDAVVFRSTERNWPEGMDNLEKRYPLQKRFTKYKAYLGAQWDNKALLIVPVAKNRRMPVNMRPYIDLYFVYSLSGVKVQGTR